MKTQQSIYRVIYRSDDTNCYHPYVTDCHHNFSIASGMYLNARALKETGQLIYLVCELPDRSVICDTYRGR